MSKLPTNEKERRLEQIVAYLDGELSSGEASRVEQQLAEDADLRQEVESIERAWSALDALPTTKVDDRFSQTTMELVVGTAREELLEQTRALPIQRRKNTLSNLLLITAATFLGLLAVRLVRENPNRTLITALPTIQYIDIYTQFRDLDFLRKLRNELGDDVWVADFSDETLAEELNQFHTVADADKRRPWIAELDDDDRRALLARYNQFSALPANDQTRLRDLHAALVAARDSEQLERTLLQYREWLSGLPASRQYELRDMPVDDRVHEIVDQVRRAANNPWIELTPEEARKLERVRRSIREQTFRDVMIPERGDAPERRGREGRQRGPNFGQQVMTQIREHRDEWLPQILAALTDEHRTKFESLPPGQQQQQLVRWIMQARDRNGRGPFAQVTQQELERFFVEETDPTDKERLLALPRQQMEQELRRRYLRSALGEDFSPEWGPFGPSRGGRGGPGPRRGFGGPGDRDGFERPPFDGPPPAGEPGFGPPPRPAEEF
jgi:hypothetical protein